MLKLSSCESFVKPTDLVSTMGSNVKFQCGGDKDKVIIWERTVGRTQGLFEQDRNISAPSYMFITDFYDLNIKNVSYDDGLEYHCSDNGQNKQSVHLIVIDKVELFQNDFNKTEQGIITCNASFASAPKSELGDMTPLLRIYLDGKMEDNGTITDYKWIKEGKPNVISKDLSFNFTWQERVLAKCELYFEEVDYRTDAESYVYAVHPLSTIDINPSKSTYVINEKIKCEPNGYPRPKVEWIGIESNDKRDGDELDINDKMLGNNKWKCKACQDYMSNTNCKEKEISFKVVKSTSDASQVVLNFSIAISFVLSIFLL